VKLQIETVTLADGRRVDVVRDVEKLREVVENYWTAFQTLTEIAGADYRGNRSTESQAAFEALAKMRARSGRAGA